MLLAWKQSSAETLTQGTAGRRNHLLPTATRPREGLILSRQESQAVISTPQCGAEEKGKSTPGTAGKRIPKETPLGAKQGYQNEDWHTRKAKADSSWSALLRVSVRLHQVKIQLIS